MEDLGSAPSVADHLLGDDPDAADDALLAWARALGTLHARTHADRAAMAAAFAEAEGAVEDEPVDRFHAGVRGTAEQATRRLGRQRRGARSRRSAGRGSARGGPGRSRAPRPQSRGRLPGQQPAAPRRLPPHRLRVGRGAAPGLGRGVPRRAVADLLVLVADPRALGRPSARGLPRGRGRGHRVRHDGRLRGRHRGGPRVLGADLGVLVAAHAPCGRSRRPTPPAPAPGHGCSTVSAWSRTSGTSAADFAGARARAHPPSSGAISRSTSPRRTAPEPK